MKKNNILTIIILLIVVGSFAFTLISQNNQKKLQVYNGDDIFTTEEKTTEEKIVNTFEFDNSEYGYTIKIPNDWDKINDNNLERYIHKPSATSVEIYNLDYEPSINMATADMISSEIVSKGYEFVNFTRLSNTSYEILYRDTSQSQIYDYIEEYYWNQNNIIKLKFIINDNNYDKVIDYISTIVNSFCWKDNTFPEYLGLYYVEQGNFEFAYPIDWIIQIANGYIVCTSQDSNQILTVSCFENTNTLENLTATDVCQQLSVNKQNFMLKSFNTSVTNACITYSYMNGANQILNKTYIFANGLMQYTLSFDYVNGSFDETIIDECVGYFREYLTKDIIEGSELATNTDSTAN